MGRTSLTVVVLVVIVMFFVLGAFFELPAPTKYVDTRIVYQPVKEYVNNTIEKPVGQIYEKNVTVYGVAVFNTSDGGELVGINLILRPGYGGLLLDISDTTFGADLQDTLPLIKSYAQAYTNKNFAYKDIIIKMDTTAANIQGTSGSAAIAVGLIALLQGIQLKNDTIVTGVLQPDGTLASVNNLDLKIAVANNVGVREFLIPRVQCTSVNESLKGNLTVTCVNSVKEALERMTA